MRHTAKFSPKFLLLEARRGGGRTEGRGGSICESGSSWWLNQLWPVTGTRDQIGLMVESNEASVSACRFPYTRKVLVAAKTDASNGTEIQRFSSSLEHSLLDWGLTADCNGFFRLPKILSLERTFFFVIFFSNTFELKEKLQFLKAGAKVGQRQNMIWCWVRQGDWTIDFPSLAHLTTLTLSLC